MKAGLEVHQQLATGKLFCDCPSELSEVVVATVARKLRATGGENHAVDPAAAFQAARGLTYRYEATPTSCLVEIDEEPPHRLNPDALDVALTITLLLNARPLDEIEVMRKIVVDGSNTAGFQRTALVGVDGSLDVGGKRYSIPSICLEEDAARRVAETNGEITFRLDRLGIPLIEIATGPEISDGTEAREVAEEIGALLRSTGRVRRGIGTIREDLNVSIEGGNRVEIKGVQDLRKIHRYVEGEEQRQTVLLDTLERLRERKATVPSADPWDVSDLLRSTATGPLAVTLKKGGVVLGTALHGFAGVLKPGPDTAERLGRELADQVRAAGLRGLVHSDEVPVHGVEGPVIGQLRSALGATGPDDAFVLVAAPSREVARTAIAQVRRRALEATRGIPAETRDPLPDGRTRYSRPLPGRDRMYPETDVPPIPVRAERLAQLSAHLPERPEAVRARLASTYGLSIEVARQIQRAGETDRLAELVHRGRSSAAVSRLLTQDLPALEAADETWETDRISTETLDGVLKAVEAGEFSKEGIRSILVEVSKGAATLEEARRRVGIEGISREALDRLAQALVEKNAAMVRARGAEAFSPLMGDLMAEVRGRRDGREIADALRAALARHAGSGAP